MDKCATKVAHFLLTSESRIFQIPWFHRSCLQKTSGYFWLIAEQLPVLLPQTNNGS